eukprot:UN03714
MHIRDGIANQLIKPILEEWVGFPLVLSSHYGIREYYSGAYLKNHVDRLDVLIISVTSSIAHLTTDTIINESLLEEPKNYWNENDSWPLEGVDWKGNNIRYDHKPGTMVLYESAKFIHGRPYRMPGKNYIHVGAFCHFRPADESWAAHKHAQNGRANINRHSKGVRYDKEPPYYPPPQKTNKEEL